MTPEFVYKNIVASNPVPPNSVMYNQSENDTLDHELRSKLSQLVYQISKEELTSSDDEPIQEVIDRRCDGEREKENDREIQREREIEVQKESNVKTDMEKNKRKMERLSKRWIERQICRECEEPCNVLRQRHREGDQKVEGSNEKERQMEKKEWEIQQKIEREKHVERSWHVRQLEIESENEKIAEKIKSVEIEPHTLALVDRFSESERHLKQGETQTVKIVIEKAKDGGVDTKKSVEEEQCEKGHYLNEEKANRGLLQRSKSERGSEKRREAHSHSAPSDPEEQMSPTEVSRKITESVGQFQVT